MFELCLKELVLYCDNHLSHIQICQSEFSKLKNYSDGRATIEFCDYIAYLDNFGSKNSHFSQIKESVQRDSNGSSNKIWFWTIKHCTHFCIQLVKQINYIRIKKTVMGLKQHHENV